jgi:hypothetical protein
VYQRSFTQTELAAWFSPDSVYGARARASLSAADLEQIGRAILAASKARPLPWPFAALFVQTDLAATE